MTISKISTPQTANFAQNNTPSFTLLATKAKPKSEGGQTAKKLWERKEKIKRDGKTAIDLWADKQKKKKLIFTQVDAAPFFAMANNGWNIGTGDTPTTEPKPKGNGDGFGAENGDTVVKFPATSNFALSGLGAQPLFNLNGNENPFNQNPDRVKVQRPNNWEFPGVKLPGQETWDKAYGNPPLVKIPEGLSSPDTQPNGNGITAANVATFVLGTAAVIGVGYLASKFGASRGLARVLPTTETASTFRLANVVPRLSQTFNEIKVGAQIALQKLSGTPSRLNFAESTLPSVINVAQKTQQSPLKAYVLKMVSKIAGKNKDAIHTTDFSKAADEISDVATRPSGIVKWFDQSKSFLASTSSFQKTQALKLERMFAPLARHSDNPEHLYRSTLRVYGDMNSVKKTGNIKNIYGALDDVEGTISKHLSQKAFSTRQWKSYDLAKKNLTNSLHDEKAALQALDAYITELNHIIVSTRQPKFKEITSRVSSAAKKPFTYLNTKKDNFIDWVYYKSGW